MRYPVLTRSRTDALARSLVNDDLTPNWELERSWIGSGQDVSLADLEVELAGMRSALEARSDGGAGKRAEGPESIEGRFSGAVHRALRDLPIDALDDPGFWRYLSLAHFWWFISVREAPAIGRGNVMTYVDGGKECVPFRMFLRAQAIRDGDDYVLAGALPKSADFWRSHILRVKTGSAPPLARAFARLQADKRMVSDDLRPFARRVNRLWSNVAFHTWDDATCDQLLAELYDETFPTPSDAPEPPET